MDHHHYKPSPAPCFADFSDILLPYAALRELAGGMSWDDVAATASAPAVVSERSTIASLAAQPGTDWAALTAMLLRRLHRRRDA